ncbi:glycosyltransferase family 9 protein [Sutterella sp.]|uniref:glycosyltransferase family 9 protein n=1 Tax=Sutterella sp. TaxID=1981025 RepID=UPI003FD7AA83
MQNIPGCSLIITPDTSIIHVASAFNIPVVAMYRNNGREYYNYTMLETLTPLFETREIIISSEKLKRSPPYLGYQTTQS